jgi:outer membrane protein assembly factor BamA
MRRALFLFLAYFCAFAATSTNARPQSNTEVSDSRDHFAYSFSNFVWWSDQDLRTSLKRHIPTLADTLPRNSSLETKISAVLDASGVLNEAANRFQLKPYVATSFWFDKQQIELSLKQVGYLSSSVDLKPGTPRKDGERYLVPLTAIITAGAKYHVSTVKADGGPLFQGRDLSPYFALKPGDVATPSAFGRLAGLLRSAYWHAGYADVEFRGDPELNTTTAMASYRFEVIPGPIYRLRSIQTKNLNATQENQVKDLLGIKPGDVYDALAVATLNQKMARNSTLSGWGNSYTSHEDKQAQVVDLILNFYKN